MPILFPPLTVSEKLTPGPRGTQKVCGHPGTISFSSPEYEAFEDPAAWAGEDIAATYGAVTTNGTFRVTVRRTGGGYGSVGVRYRLRHGTTDAADVTPHAHFTTRLGFDRRVLGGHFSLLGLYPSFPLNHRQLPPEIFATA